MLPAVGRALDGCEAHSVACAADAVASLDQQRVWLASAVRHVGGSSGCTATPPSHSLSIPSPHLHLSSSQASPEPQSEDGSP
jgi:hypothetical protein